MYHSFILCVYDLSTSLHPFFFCLESTILILYLNFMLYPLYILNRSSFNNMLPYPSFTLSYRMNVNDVLYSVITIYTAYHVRNHICVCVYLVRFSSYLLAML